MCVCGSILTIGKVGKKWHVHFTVKTYCLDPHLDLHPDPHLDPESVFENLDPLDLDPDPDPHQNPVDPHQLYY